MLANCAPLSFLDVEQNDYALAMLGVYEKLDVAIAVELFAWTYRRSIAKYKVIIESMGGPDLVRVRYREQLTEAVCQVVYHGSTADETVNRLNVAALDLQAFRGMLDAELQHLEVHSCARYRLPFGKTQEWIAKGRPS